MKKNDLAKAQRTLKQIVKKAHLDAMHKNTGSRLKSIIRLQKTSIGMFLDSVLNGYKQHVSKKNHNTEINDGFAIMHSRQDIWDNYQKGGDYPATFGYVTILMIESLSGQKANEKLKEAACKEMLEELDSRD